MKESCLVAMSGGVDSAVAARLMQEQGAECFGCTMDLCARSPEESREAARTCALLGIPHEVLELEEEFRRLVMDPFAEEYFRGRTPNPCVRCNRYLKFGALCRRAEELGCSSVATGHYARVERRERDGRYLLKKAADPQKDQSYVLWMLTQDQLRRIRFPLGTLTKAQTRRMAEQWGFSNAHKAESQDICFVPDGDYAGFLERYTGKSPKPGHFTDRTGAVLGQHRGIIHYTVGQRRGLGIAWSEPLYVLSVDPEENRVVLGGAEALFTRELWAEQVNFVSAELSEAPVECRAKIRYRHPERECTARMENGLLHVVFREPQRAVTPGQSVVLYDGDLVLAGGVIR